MYVCLLFGWFRRREGAVVERVKVIKTVPLQLYRNALSPSDLHLGCAVPVKLQLHRNALSPSDLHLGCAVPVNRTRKRQSVCTRSEIDILDSFPDERM